jgi:hypothetical protein
VIAAVGLNGECPNNPSRQHQLFSRPLRTVDRASIAQGLRGFDEICKKRRRIWPGGRVQGLTVGNQQACLLIFNVHYLEEITMSRRISLLVAAVLLLNLGGCVFLPGHRDHCCWRGYGVVTAPSAQAVS